MREKLPPSWRCSIPAWTCWKAQRSSLMQVESSSKQLHNQSPTVLDYVLETDHDSQASALARPQVLLSHSLPADGLAHGRRVRGSHLGLHVQDPRPPVNCNPASGSPARHPGLEMSLPAHPRRDGRHPTTLRTTPDTARLNTVRRIVQLSNKRRRLPSRKSKGLDFDHLMVLSLQKSSCTICNSRRPPCLSQPPKSSPLPSEIS